MYEYLTYDDNQIPYGKYDSRSLIPALLSLKLEAGYVG